MAKILLEARDNVLIASTEGVITSDTISVPCSISFSDEWAQYGKTIFFYQNPRKPHRVVVAGQSADFEVPPQAIITGGELHIGVFGNYTDGEGNPQRKVAVATSVLAAKGSYSGTDLPKPSVSEYEQIISIMMAYMDAREVAEIAKEAAEQIAADASAVKGYVDEASAHAAAAQTAAAASASARDESLAAINEALSARDEVVEVAEEALNEMGGYNAKVQKNSKRATNAEDASTVKTPDSSVAYTKTVPANALPYAEITEIGGTTRKCTNLLPHAPNPEVTEQGVVFKRNENGSVTINGTATGDAYYPLKSDWVLNGGQYTASMTYTDNSIAGSCYMTVKRTAKDSTVNWYNLKGGVATFSGDATINAWVFVKSGTTVSNITVFPMLNEGNTALPYEPYFEGLRSAPVSAVESVGVNMCPPFVKGVGLNFDYGNETVSATSATTDFIRIDLSEEEHFLSGMVNTLPFLAVCYDIDKNYLGRTGAVTSDGIVLRQNLLARGVDLNALHYIRITTYENSALGTGVISDFDNATPMLNKGSTALSYTPYFKRAIEIPEAVRPANGIPNGAHDFIEWREGGTIKGHECVGRVDLGTLNWDYNSTHSRFGATMPTVTKILYTQNFSVCSLDYNFKVYFDSDRTNGYCINLDRIFVRDSKYTDAATFKAAMSGVMLYYELAEPIITDISGILPADNFIQVEEGGTVTMVNEHEYDVPSTVVYRVPKVGDDYVMISSPNGTVYKLTVSDSGSISAVKT